MHYINQIIVLKAVALIRLDEAGMLPDNLIHCWVHLHIVYTDMPLITPRSSAGISPAGLPPSSAIVLYICGRVNCI